MKKELGGVGGGAVVIAGDIYSPQDEIGLTDLLNISGGQWPPHGLPVPASLNVARCF